jgi:hypothetical protein
MVCAAGWSYLWGNLTSKQPDSDINCQYLRLSLPLQMSMEAFPVSLSATNISLSVTA